MGTFDETTGDGAAKERGVAAGFTDTFEEKAGDGVARERGGVAENAGCCLGA